MERKVVVELKSIGVLREVHHIQLLTYPKLGLLINFNVPHVKNGIFAK